jgi:hypothetical protein
MDLSDETITVLRARALADELKESTNPMDRHTSGYLCKLLGIAAQTGHLDVKYLLTLIERYKVEDTDAV